MKLILTVALTSAVLFAAGAANATEALAKSSGCLTCHAIDAKKVGPSFKETAAKYKGKSDAEAALVAKLSAAKGHPEVKAKPDDIKTLVKFVLAQ
jgi:cytochrome c